MIEVELFAGNRRTGRVVSKFIVADDPDDIIIEETLDEMLDSIGYLHCSWASFTDGRTTSDHYRAFRYFLSLPRRDD